MTEKITEEGHTRAVANYPVRLLPTSAEIRPHSVAQSVSWGPFAEGDWITICIAAECYLRTGGEAVVATTADIVLPIGVHDFTVPTGVTHVALLSTLAGATAAVWLS